MKYKLLKNTPNCNAGEIFEYCKEHNQYFDKDKICWYGINTIENNKQWFSKFILKSEDNVDIFEGEYAYLYFINSAVVVDTNHLLHRKHIDPGTIINSILDDIVIFNDITVFKHKANAEEYKKSIKQKKYTINDVCNATEYLFKVREKYVSEYNKDREHKWEPQWNNHFGVNYTVIRIYNSLSVVECEGYYTTLSFPTSDIAKKSLEEHKELWEVYFQL